MIRAKQWVKNGFVFAPLVFAGLTGSAEAVFASILAFCFFSFAASVVYITNDLADLALDRAHPRKSKIRPVASGEVTPRVAMIYLVLFLLLSFSSVFWNRAFAAVIIGYILINVFYSLYLKNIPVLDIFTIASGFPFRVYAGALAIGVPLSQWMFVTVFSLALFLASIKRLREMKDQESAVTRPVLQKYSLKVIEQFVQVSAMASIVFYSLFVLTSKEELVLTIPLVLFGFFRYMLITDEADNGESPTDTLLHDWPMLVTVALWIVLSMLLLRT